jgi:Tfp pilus assembly protein PilX
MQLKQRGAFLVIAMILLIVLSALGVAAMSLANTAARVSQNYGAYLNAKAKAMSMAGYGLRILQTFPNGVYYGPGTCSTAATCNKIDSTFPMSGRPLLPWSSGAGTTPVTRSSENDAWWNTNAFAYETTFAGSGNARVVVALLGSNPSSPYQYTYSIVGYATDPTGIVKATYQMYYVWEAYPADPGDGTCSGSCHYANCCSDTNTCATDAASCASGSATYVPPGWTCTQYFVTGLGYSSSACNNPVAPPS